MTPAAVILHARRFSRILAFCLATGIALHIAPTTSAETGITNVVDGTTVNAGGGYIVGNSGTYNALIITNAGVLNVVGNPTIIGSSVGAKSNRVVVAGAGSVLNGGPEINIGRLGGSFNELIIANGGGVFADTAAISAFVGANNSVLVTGSGSVWSNSSVWIGGGGQDNRLTIANGGLVVSGSASISGGQNNTVTVDGAGSVWNISDGLSVGGSGSRIQLTITTGGLVSAKTVSIGGLFTPSSGDITVSGGSLVVTNSSHNSTLDVRYGTLTVNNGGIVTTDLLQADYGANGVVSLNCGILSAGTAYVSNGVPFVVGDGVSSAALMLNSGTPRGGRATPVSLFSSPGVSFFANDLVVRNHGVLSLFARANVGGNYIQNSGGALMVGFGGTAPGQYGYLNITGTASLAGMMEAISFGGFTPTNGMQITFLHANGGISGSFSSFSNVTAMAASIIYPNANDVAVQWSQTPFGSYGLTPGQSAVGGALDRDVNNPRMGALVNLLNSLPTRQLPAALESLSPRGLASTPMVGLGAAGVQAGNLQSRFGALQGGVGGGLSGGFSLFDPRGMMDWIDRQPRFVSMLPAELELAMSKEALASGILRRSADNPWGVFVEGAGQFVGVESVPTASGYHVTTAGLTVGVDRQVLDAAAYPHDQIVVGLAIGYNNATTYLTADGRVDINGVQGTAYGTWFREGWHAEASVGGGCNLYDTRRDVLGQTASGDTQGTAIQGMLGGGYDWRMEGWTFGPRVTVQYTTVDIDGFTESGSLAPLKLGSQSMDSLVTHLGVRVARTLEVGKTLWTPEVRLGWQHESLDSVTAVDAQFANGSGNIFSTSGVPLGRDAMVAGAGLTVQWTKTLATYVNYGTELMRNHYSVHNVNAGVRFSF